MNARTLAVTATALIILACSPAGASVPAGVEGRTFLSVDVTVNGAQHPLVANTRIQLSFNDGNLGASAGCNHIGGTYRIDNGRLVTDAMGMTEMGCDPARHAQDEWLSSFLGSRPQLRLNGNELILEGNSTVVRMLDREVAQPDRPLTGTQWLLTSIIDGDAVSSVPEGVIATLQLSDDGNFSIQVCNQGGGRYTVEGGTITFGDMMLTRMACEDPRGQVEAAVVAVLEAGQVGFSIDADSLTLTADGAGLGFSAQPER